MITTTRKRHRLTTGLSGASSCQARRSSTRATGRENEWPVYATSPMVPSRLDLEKLVAEDYNDIDSVYWHGVMGSVENEWYGTTTGSTAS